MTDKKDYKPSLVTEKVILSGKVKFSNVGKPMSYDPTTKKYVENQDGDYDVTLLILEGDKQLEMLEKLYKDAIAYETQGLTRAKAQSLNIKNSPASRVDTDKEGNETGYISLRLKRRGKAGAPIVRDMAGEKITPDFIRQGSDVKVQVRASSYNAFGGVGLSFRLEAVRVIKEAELPEGYEPKAKAIVEAEELTLMETAEFEDIL